MERKSDEASTSITNGFTGVRQASTHQEGEPMLHRNARHTDTIKHKACWSSSLVNYLAFCILTSIAERAARLTKLKNSTNDSPLLHESTPGNTSDPLNPWQLPHIRFASQDARRQTFNAQLDHDTLQRLQIGGYDMLFRQQTRGDVADALAAAGFFTQLGNGQAHCFACNRLLKYSETYNTRNMQLHALHEHNCTFMRSQLGLFDVQVYLEADRNTYVHLSESELLTHFLRSFARNVRLDGLSISQLPPGHFSRVPGRQPDQRDMPSYLQLLVFMESLYAQLGPILSTFREVLSQFSVLTLQYVVLIVTQAGHRETNGREILEFARYMQYRMRQLGRSDMDSFVRDCLRNLESMNVEEVWQQNLTRSGEYLALSSVQEHPLPALTAALRAVDAEPDSGHIDYAADYVIF